LNIISFTATNFRNINKFSEEFSRGINIFFGDNAQGKTNLIEALYIIGTTKSFRRVDDEKLVNFNSESAKINAKIIKNMIEKDVSFCFSKHNSKKILINNKSVKKHSEYIGNVNITLFCPEDLMIIKGDASYRRRFLDILLCQTDKVYLSDLINYQRVIKHRNNILKKIRDGNTNSRSLLESWNEQFIKFSYKIIQKRTKSIKKIEENAKYFHKKLNNHEDLSIDYNDAISCGKKISAADYELSFKNKQKKVQAEEIKRGFTLIGPHRDDLEIKINAINTRFFGSQGQKRSAAISLRLAEAEYINSVMNEYPILLLDDIFSELDEQRKNDLMKLLDQNQQTFITGTCLSEFQPLTTNAKIFFIKEGKATVYQNEK